MFCKNCGKEVIEGQKFCKNCGALIPNTVKQKKAGINVFAILTTISVLFIILIGLFLGKDYIMDIVDNFTNNNSNVVKFVNDDANDVNEIETEQTTAETTQKRELTFSELITNAKKVSDYNSNSTVSDFDTIKFGKYYTNNSSKGDIEWIVIDKSVTADGRKYAMLTSKYVLDCIQYSIKNEYTFWENSIARQWLNNNFYDEAFSSDDKEKIIEMPLSNPHNAVYTNVEGGNNTVDKVFLLNCDECAVFFGGEVNGQNSKLATSATDYAVSKGAYKHISDGFGNGNSMFWLRSPGNTKTNACDVSPVGYLNYSGNMVVLPQGIRPTIYVWY